MARGPSRLSVAVNTVAFFAVAFAAVHPWLVPFELIQSADFWIFVTEARAGLYTSGGHPNLSNPHSHVLLYGWTAWVAPGVAYRITSSVVFLALASAAWPLARAAEGSAAWSVVPVALMITAWPHTLLAAHNGHLGAAVLLLLALAWLSLDRDDPAAAGVWLGLALAMKLFVALPVAVLALAGRRTAAAWAIGTTGAIYLLGLLILGAEPYVEHLSMLGSVEWMVDLTSNFSLAGTSARTGLPWWPVAGAVLAGVGWRSWRGSAEQALAASTAGALLLSPLSWYYYQPLLALPVLVCWKAGGWPRWTAAAGWWIGTVYRPEFPTVGALIVLASVVFTRRAELAPARPMPTGAPPLSPPPASKSAPAWMRRPMISTLFL